MTKPLPAATVPEGRVRFGAQPQHVLMTGGTGFIGRTLIPLLLADGHAVTVWTRDASAAGRRLGGTVRCVERLDQIAADEPCDVVINLAGTRILGPRWTARRRQALLDSRVGTTDALVAWIAGRARKPWLLLSGSAIGYYGIQAQGDATGLTEAAPPQDIFMSQLCQRWEAAAGAATRLGVRVTCMRFGLVLGREGSLPLLQLPIALGLGGRLGSGRQWLSWIHVADLARAMAHTWILAAQARDVPAAQAFNFTAPGALGQGDFTRTAAGVMHRPFWLPTPAAPVRWLLGEQADLLLEGQRVVPERLLQTGFAFVFPDAVAALTDLREAR
ncbi:MAG: TIGR01777 family oxidoreductase [Variovorax sp.]